MIEDGLEYKCDGVGSLFFAADSKFVHLERVTVQVGNLPYCIRRLLAPFPGSHFDAPTERLVALAWLSAIMRCSTKVVDL